MKNICIVAGARPNFVKVAPLLRAIGSRGDARCVLVYAGRKDDPTLEPSLFSDLQMPVPDVYLGVGSQRLNEITAQVMGRFDRHLEHHPADVVIVVDDLASTMAAAITAKKRGIRLAHLVAGTRSFDISMPKEVNRLVIDALSDYLFTAGVKSNSVATREQQTETSQTFMVGNILVDTLRHNIPRFCKPDIGVEKGCYLLFTINRRALLADEDCLCHTLQTMAEATGAVAIVAPLRAGAQQTVGRLLEKLHITEKKFRALPAMTYLQFGWLTANAMGIVTDSGNVAEEATFCCVPCITLNDYTEHQETVTIGSNVLVGSDTAKLHTALADIMAGRWKPCALPDKWDGHTAERIASILLAD